jgi:2-polyprenyl-3-methyl-5-hydroxy-6-metoxy-1,4-benzoquinol methylase
MMGNSNYIKVFRKLKLFIQNLFSPESAWLFKNRIERMDANRVDLFEPSRAAFHLDRYKIASKYVNAKTVLDAACGTGYGSRILYADGKASNVIGLDNDLNTIKYANAKYFSKQVRFINSSITELPFANGSFNVVVSFETIEHIIEEDKLISEIHRVIQNNGMFILSTPNDWGLSELAPFHVRSYTLEKLKAALSNWFDIREIYNQNSGTTGRKENHNQARGITQTNEQNYRLAECYIIIAVKILVPTF